MNYTLISDDQLATGDQIANELLKNNHIDTAGSWKAEARQAFGRHLLFTDKNACLRAHLPPLSVEDAFYNNYYWFLTFMMRQRRDFGSDAGIEQQSFKLLETAPPSINWDSIEEIAKIVEQKKTMKSENNE